VILDTFSARKFDTSLSVHTGCVGIVNSSSVMFAAKRSPSRRGDPWRETASTLPNWTDVSIGCTEIQSRYSPTPRVALAGSRAVSYWCCFFPPAEEAACCAYLCTVHALLKSRYSTIISTKMSITSSVRCSLGSILQDCRSQLLRGLGMIRHRLSMRPES
jgi:hypothetical protein